MKTIIKAISNVFPETNVTVLLPETKLYEISGWDSMNAINLQMELATLLQKEDLDFKLSDKMTLKDIADELSKLGVHCD
jgi:acyl carrier protein